MDKGKKNLLIVIGVCVLIFGGIEACVKKENSVVNFDYVNADQYIAASTGTASVQEVNQIHIKWVNGDITVQYSPQDQITWQETYIKGNPSEDDCLHYFIDENELNLVFCAAGQRGLHVKKDLTVTLPQDWRPEELEIENVNGTVRTSIDAHEITIESVNGDKYITTSHTDKIDIEGVNSANYIYLPENTAFRAEFEKVNGTFSSDFATDKLGDTFTYGQAPYMEIDVEVVNGGLYIKKQ